MLEWRDRLGATLCWAVAAAVVGVFGWILGDLLLGGLEALSWEFLTAEPRDAGREGGIAPILVSTAGILAVCLGAAVPVGLLAAVWLAESRATRAIRGIRRCIDLLAGVPSIVFGLFGAALFVDLLGLGYSILAGGLTLGCMILPVLIRATEASLRAVPSTYRLGGAALGLSRWATLRTVLLPAAVPGLAAGLVLGIGRAMAETAALLFTSGYVTRMPTSVLESGRSLSVHVYDLAMNVPGGDQAAYGSALLLLGALLVIHTLAGRLAGRLGADVA